MTRWSLTKVSPVALTKFDLDQQEAFATPSRSGFPPIGLLAIISFCQSFSFPSSSTDSRFGWFHDVEIVPNARRVVQGVCQGGGLRDVASAPCDWRRRLPGWAGVTAESEG